MRRRLVLPGSVLSLVVLAGLGAVGGVLAGGGCHVDGSTEAVPAEGVATVVKIDGCTFAPTVTRVPVGSVVRFLNASTRDHDVTGRYLAWGSGPLASGADFSQRFATAGVYPYSCSLHAGMAGVVIVGGSAAAAVTDGQQAGAPAAAAAQPESAAAATTAGTTDPGDGILPIAAAAGLGLLAGALGTAVLMARRSEIAG